MKKDYKILITVPASTARGGITNYYQVLREELPSNVEYFERGSRTWPVRKGAISEVIRAWNDYKAFKNRIKQGDIALVQTSTSLGFNSIIRDGFFLKYARRKGLKTIVFFRGWDIWAEKKTEKYLWLFKYFFFKCNSIIALNKHTKETLAKWGFTGNVFLETTLFDKHFTQTINRENLEEKFNKLENDKTVNLLFLSRVEERKGIFELIEAYHRLKGKQLDYELTLNICGDGFGIDGVKEIISRENIPNISVSGFIEKQEKIRAYQQAHIFVFPSYGEGMPNAVLEAMGFGLPVLTTAVGGVKDFFENGANGHFIEIKSVSSIEEKLVELLNNPKQMFEMSFNNFQKANRLFRSDIVAKRVEAIFEKVIKSQQNEAVNTAIKVG